MGSPDAAYVGDGTCASCHEDLYQSYKLTGMGRSVSLFDPSTAPEVFGDEAVFNPVSRAWYSAVARNDSMFQRTWRLDANGDRYAEREYPVDLVIGSGNATRSYLMNVGGFVTEMPLTWYVDRSSWEMSPGYEQIDRGFDRPVTLECMTCHNATPEHSAFTPNHYTRVPEGISCERCHGPGSAHVDRALAGMVDESDTTIVNPARLDRELQLSVCQQCHLTGISVFNPGEDPTTFRPGTLIAAHRSVFVESDDTASDAVIGIASHAARLAQSECFVASDMTCTTCHDPHVPVSSLGVDSFNAACTSCHTPDAASVLCSRSVTNDAERMTGDCSGCHMPKSGTSDIPHVTFTDHLIRPVRAATTPAGPIASTRIRPDPLTLVRATTPEADLLSADLQKAKAYFNVYETTHELPAYLDSVVVLAGPLVEASGGVSAEVSGEPAGEDAEGRLVLGRAYMERGEHRRAAQVLGALANEHGGDALAAYWYAVALAEAERVDEAISWLGRATEIQPLLGEAHLKRGSLLLQVGRIDEAERAFRNVIRIDPVHHPAAYNNLGFLLMQSGRTDEAVSAFDNALAITPHDVVTLLNAASVNMILTRWDAAEELLTRAIEVEPTSTGALGNLGIIYAQSGRITDARRMFARLLELDPTDARARSMLEEIDE